MVASGKESGEQLLFKCILNIAIYIPSILIAGKYLN